MSKIPVYFMPGFAASAAIFERISLPEDIFEMHLLEWEIPLANESLGAYAQRIAKKIRHENPVLIGVSFGEKINHRIKLYEKFLSVRDIGYLEWAVEKVILWDRTVVDESVVHIHGDLDDVFPIKYVSDCTVVKGGTHVMILNKYKWLNANLPAIILET